VRNDPRPKACSSALGPTRTCSAKMTMLCPRVRWRWRRRLHRNWRRRRESHGRPVAIKGVEPGDQPLWCPMLDPVAVLTTPMPGVRAMISTARVKLRHLASALARSDRSVW